MTQTQPSPSAPIAAPSASDRTAAWIVGCALFLQTLDATIVSVALPTIAREFAEPVLRLNSTITMYLLSSAVFIPISGWLADRYGSKLVFQIAIVLFTLASVLCGLSDNLTTLVAARCLQGAAAAMITPIGRMIVVQRYAKSDLVGAMSFLGIPIVLGPVLGPPLGGFIVEYLSWHWIFFVNIPIGVLVFWLVRRFISDVRAETRQPLDLIGFALSGLGTASLVGGLAAASEPTTHPALWIAPLLAGTALLIAFVCYALPRPQAILDLKMFNSFTFASSIVGGSLLRLGVGASPFLLALLLQVEFGLNPLSAGLIVVTSAVAALMMKTTAAPIIRRFGYRNVLVANTLVLTLMLSFWGFLSAATPIALVMVVLFAGGFTRSLQFTALNTLIFADIDPAKIGRASSLSSTVQQLAESLGISLSAVILATALRYAGDSVQPVALCFFFLSVINLVALPFFLKLPADAGEAVRGRARER